MLNATEGRALCWPAVSTAGPALPDRPRRSRPAVPAQRPSLLPRSRARLTRRPLVGLQLALLVLPKVFS